MAVSVYHINKGINKPIEFKGLKAQYIWYMGGVLLVLLIVYIILYMVGINQYLCVGIVVIAGFVLTQKIFAMSKKYGEHGLTKMMAGKGIPTAIKSRDRTLFIH